MRIGSKRREVRLGVARRDLSAVRAVWLAAVMRVAVTAALVAAFLTLPGGLLVPSPSNAERVLRGGVIIAFDGGITPNVLPRKHPRPITARLSGRVRAADGGPLPHLQRLQIEINRDAVINSRGLPVCPLSKIRDALVAEALRNCGRSRVGSGVFGVTIALPDQKMTRTTGRVLAFHSRIGGRRAVLLHVVTLDPLAVAITVPLTLHPQSRGKYGQRLVSPPLSKVISRYIYTTDFSFSLGRVYATSAGRKGYLSAACKAPPGLNGGSFALARATYEFTDGRKLRQSLIRNCRVARG